MYPTKESGGTKAKAEVMTTTKWKWEEALLPTKSVGIRTTPKRAEELESITRKVESYIEKLGYSVDVRDGYSYPDNTDDPLPYIAQIYTPNGRELIDDGIDQDSINPRQYLTDLSTPLDINNNTYLISKLDQKFPVRKPYEIGGLAYPDNN